MGTNQPDNWTLSEIFLDLLQDKLLNFQKFYDLSVEERDSLKREDTVGLASILKQKGKLQQKINQIEHQIHRLENRHPLFINQMNSEQKVEFNGTIHLIVELLQNIIDYEENNREIAQSNKKAIQEDLNQLSQGSKLLANYFRKPAVNAHFIDKAH
ncbi:MAG: flagellar protein FlgN [Candidatus Marinimicrobia bacterium]|nr:flagellar protein FlgN [Candidatus Neomarinimicrobiota bacterium]MCF7880547.1 flagellar protein FlgN [Candidatus Neomarinimicrobiota bacterium]